MIYKAKFISGGFGVHNDFHSYGVIDDDGHTGIESEVSVNCDNVKDIIQLISAHIAAVSVGDMQLSAAVESKDNLILIEVYETPYDDSDPRYDSYISGDNGETTRIWILTDDNKSSAACAIAAYLNVMLSSKPNWGCTITEME